MLTDIEYINHHFNCGLFGGGLKTGYIYVRIFAFCKTQKITKLKIK